MVYESKILKKRLEEDFNARMKLYLNSKSIHEYIIERDLKGLNTHSFKWTDVFVWWYLFHEKRHVIVFWSLLAIVAPICIQMLGVWWAWMLIFPLEVAVLICLFIMKSAINQLAHTQIPRSVDSHNYGINFDLIDQKTSSLQTEDEED